MNRAASRLYYFHCAECGRLGVKRWNQRPEVKGYTTSFCNKSCSGRYSQRQQLMRR